MSFWLLPNLAHSVSYCVAKLCPVLKEKQTSLGIFKHLADSTPGRPAYASTPASGQ